MKKGKLIVVFLLALICICTLCFTACNNTDTFYTVVFDSNGGSFVESQNVRENRSAVEPASPVKDGYTFAGWYTDRNFTSRYDFRNIVTENLYLYAKWENMVYVAVNFPVTTIESKGYAFKDSSGGLNLPSRVPRGSTVNFLVETSSTLTGSLEVRINGSLLTPSYTSNPNVYSFSFVADRNFSVSAGIYYDVEFTSTYADGTINTVTRKLEQDQTVTSYVETRPGEHFGGWFYNYNGENLLATDLTVGYMVSGPILKLTGNYSYKNYTIEFVMNGGTYNGTSLEKQSITYGDFLSLYDVYKVNYIFMGWYTENNGGGQKIESGTFERDYPNNSTIKLYAYFVKNYYSIQYNSAPNEFSYTNNPSTVRYNTEGDTVFNVSISLNQPDVKVKLYYKIGSQSTEYREQVVVPDEQSQGQSVNFQITLPSLPPENESIYIYYDIYYKVNFELDGGSNGNLSYDNVFVKQNTVLMRAGSEANFSSSDTRAISTLVSILYKDEYTFICWYLDEEMANQLTPNYAILSPITLYASFSYNYHIISYPSSEAESGNYDPDLGTKKYYYYAVTPTEKIPVTSSSFQLKLSFTNNTAKVIVQMFEEGTLDAVYSESFLVYGSNFSNTFNIDISEYNISNNFVIKVTVFYRVYLGGSQGIQISSSNNPQSVSDDGNRVIYFNGDYYFYLKNGERINDATKEALNGVIKQYHNFVEYTSDDQGESAIDLENFTCTGSTTIYPQFEEKIYNVVLPSSGSAGYGEQEFYTVSGNSTVRADAGQYAFTINLKDKQCYYLEVSVNGTKLGDFYSDSADEDKVLNVAYPITDNLDATLTFTITVYLKTEFNLNGGYLISEPGENDPSGLQKVSDSLYYLITGISGSINEAAQNILLPSNIERDLGEGNLITSMGWYRNLNDESSLVALPNITIDQNLILYSKYNTTFYSVNLPKMSETGQLPSGYGENEFYTVQGMSSVWSGNSSYTFDLLLEAKECYEFVVFVNGEKLNNYLYSSANDRKISITFSLSQDVNTYTVTVNVNLKINIILNDGAFVNVPTNESGLIEEQNAYYAIIDYGSGFNESAKAALALNNIKYEDRVCLGLYYDSNFSNQFNIGDKFTENCSLYAKFDGVPKTINLPTSSSDGYGAENFYTVDGESSVQASESSYTFTLNLGAKECYAFEVSVNGTKLTNEYLYSSAENRSIEITFDLTSDVTVYTVTVNIKLKVNVILNGGAFKVAPTSESGLIEDSDSNVFYAIIGLNQGFNESAKSALSLDNIENGDKVCSGLYYDSNFSQQFNTGDTFTENRTLYAKFEGELKTINLPTSLSVGYGAENFYTVDGESSVQASESSYTFDIILGTKECYAFEVNLNGNKINDYFYSSAQNGKIAITFSLSEDVNVYNVVINVKLKITFNLNGASFNTQPDEESALISSGEGVYYTILDLESPLNSSAQNALALTNLSSGNNIAVGWYENQDFTNSISLTDISFNENKTLYLKIEVKFTITFDDGVDSITKDSENFKEIVIYIEPNGAISNTYINTYLQGFGYNINYKDYYKFKSWNLNSEPLPSNGINVSAVSSFDIKLTTQRSTFSYQLTNSSTDLITVNTVVVDSDGTELGLPFDYGTLLKIGAVSNNSAYIVKAYMEKADNTLFELTRRDEAGFNYGIYFKETSETGDFSNCAYIEGFGTRDNNDDYVIKIKIEAIENTQQPTEKTFTVNYGAGISNITKDAQSYASGSLQITIALNTTITEDYLNGYLSDNGYTVNYAEGYKYGGWKVGDSLLTEAGITVTESTATTLTILADEIVVAPTHTIVLPQGTNSNGVNYDVNCGEEYEVVSTETSVAVGTESYVFTIKALKNNIAKIEIYVNNGDTPANTVTNPSSDTETVYNYTIPLAQTQTTYTITVKVYYNLELNTNGATVSSQNATALGLSTASYGYYITLEKGSNVSETLKTALSTNTYNGNPLFTKENCTFGGWYTSSDLSGSTYNFSNLTSLNSATSLYLKMVENTQQPTEKTFTVNYGAGISNITKGTESYASGSLQIAVALNTTITESYLNSYLSDNGYNVIYAEGYVYNGWKVGNTALTESGITVTESTSTALTLLAKVTETPAYYTIVLPQGTNSNGVNYDVNCEDEYEVLSTETSAAVGETSYTFKIEVLKSNIAKIEIHVNGCFERSQTNPAIDIEYEFPIGLAQTQTTYTITVKVYYNLKLNTNGATMSSQNATALGLSTDSYGYYITLEKGSNVSETLKTALSTNTYNGNPLFTKENCTFGGWYTSSDLSGSAYNFSNLTSLNSTTSLYLKMNEVVAPVYHTIVLPQSTEDYSVLSTETSVAVGTESYVFTIKALESDIAKIEIYVNGSCEITVTNPSSDPDTVYDYTIPLAQTQTTYTITVKVYYNLKLNTNGATISSQNATALGLNTDSYGYYITLEKGSNIDITLKPALDTNTYNGNTLFTKANCTFGGWYMEAEFNNPVNFGNFSIDSTTTIYLKMNEVVAPVYHTIVLPQGTNSNGVNYDVNCEDEYEVVSTETSAAVGETSYDFKIKVLKSNIARIEIYANSSLEGTQINPNTNTEYYNYPIELAQTQTTYTITVKVYYNLELYINGATTGYAENLGLNNYQNSKFYKTYEKGSNIDNTLKTALRTNTYNGNPLFTKDNCTFGGWYTDLEFNNPVDFDNLSIDSTTSLYLKMVIEFTIIAGTEVTITKDGYQYDGFTINIPSGTVITAEYLENYLYDNGYILDYTGYRGISWMLGESPLPEDGILASEANSTILTVNVVK